jgi:hypothetical protein
MADQYPRTTPDGPPAYDDNTPLGRNAATKDERALVLRTVLNGVWANIDIGKIERFEPAGGRFYLAMWSYKANNSQ